MHPPGPSPTAWPPLKEPVSPGQAYFSPLLPRTCSGHPQPPLWMPISSGGPKAPGTPREGAPALHKAMMVPCRHLTLAPRRKQSATSRCWLCPGALLGARPWAGADLGWLSQHPVLPRGEQSPPGVTRAGAYRLPEARRQDPDLHVGVLPGSLLPARPLPFLSASQLFKAWCMASSSLTSPDLRSRRS